MYYELVLVFVSLLFMLVLAICSLICAAYLYFKEEICRLIKPMTSSRNLKDL